LGYCLIMTIRIDGTNTAANPGITGADADTGLQFGTDEVSIVTGGTDRVTVDSSGNVGIGNSTPAHKLDIDNGQARINRGNSAGDILILRGQNSEQAKFDTDGLKFNGDTAAANALDDYEEGTWTPDINLSGGTNTVNTAWGKYTKIGNIVYLWFRMVFNNTTTASIYELQNLPFVVGGMSSQFPGPSISNFYKINLGSGGTVLGGYWKNGVNELRFHSCGNNTQQNTPSIGQANSNIEIRGQGYYSVS